MRYEGKRVVKTAIVDSTLWLWETKSESPECDSEAVDVKCLMRLIGVGRSDQREIRFQFIWTRSLTEGRREKLALT